VNLKFIVMQDLIKYDFSRLEDRMGRLADAVTKLSPNPNHIILDNKGIQELLNVGARTVQTWRENGLISYSKVRGQIYYRLSDVLQMLDEYRIPAIKTGNDLRGFKNTGL
jgi:hypothetical protein